MQVNSSVAVSYANVAHGNVMSGNALAYAGECLGLDVHVVPLTASSMPVNLFHGKMSASPEAAAAYTAISEERRLGPAARVYGAAAFAEFAVRTARCERPLDWTVTQEHQLLGASRMTLRALGISEVNVVVPDVFPKKSAIHAARRLGTVVMNVWNKAAYDELNDEAVPARLIKPFLLEGYKPSDRPFEGGDSVVVKTSGSGMPADWLDDLMVQLNASGADYSVHTPRWQHSPGYTARLSGADRCARYLFGRVGPNTQNAMAYPSEVVQWLLELRMRGSAVTMLSFPPRGDHELRNMIYGFEAGLIVGELSFSPDQKPTTSQIPLIPVRSLGEHIGATNAPKPGVAISTQVGANGYWQQRLGLQGGAVLEGTG